MVSQLLNNTCVQMRESGGTSRTVADRKRALGFADWDEGKLLDHTTARDFICDKPRWAAFLRGWEPQATVELFTESKAKKMKVNVADVVNSLWD